MSEPRREILPNSFNNDGLDERFRRLRYLANHWNRSATPRTYYWYLTFEPSPQLQSLVKQCQAAISFPYYDLIPESDLHLTLDRIAFEDDITPTQLRSIEAAAIHACAQITPFDISIGSLGGTPGALGFSASPSEPIRHLRDALREATLSVHPKAPIKDAKFHPHLTIAYCNSADIPAARAIAMVERLRTLPSADVAVKESSLVLLERRQRTYAWQEISRIPLSGQYVEG
ncbi:2'-5' RNA ligase family protein [Nonomuraea sp. B19D2]|uniref:2'-5' RNA ligase family protein n=1 Tax=Nonomuraea sp. B19D2 TaxID=3159561 RepID=UPI0032DA8681